MRIRSVAMTVGVFVVGLVVGMWIAPLLPMPQILTSDMDQKDDQQLNDAGNRALALEEKQADGGERSSCRASAVFPLVALAGDVSADARDRMNARITELAVAFFAGPGEGMTPPPDTIEEAIGVWTSDCRLSNAGVQTQDGYSAGWYNTMTYQIMLNDGHMLSVGLYDEQFEGGAHPNTWREYVTFDVASGKELVLDDVLQDVDRVAFARSVAERLVGMHDVLNEDTLAQMDAFLAGPTSEAAEEILADAWRFSLTADVITIHYNPYEVAAYVAGPVDIILPRP